MFLREYFGQKVRIPIYSFAILIITITKCNSKEYVCMALKGFWVVLAFDPQKHTRL